MMLAEAGGDGVGGGVGGGASGGGGGGGGGSGTPSVRALGDAALGGGGGGSVGAAFRWQQPAWFNEFMCRVWLRARHDVSRRMQRKLVAALRDGAPQTAPYCPSLPLTAPYCALLPLTAPYHP